jgi:long-chain acyl-CoA synthetase
MKKFEHFLQRLRSYSANPCIEDDGSTYTYANLLERLESWQSRLEQLNVEPGAVIGLRADYSLDAVAALLALISKYAIVALIPRDRAVEQYLVDAKAAAVMDLHVDGRYEWHATAHPVNHPLLERLRAAGDGGIVMFTSGSTGRPKAALHSAERFVSKFQDSRRQFRTLAFLLFDHVAGQDTIFYTLASGGTLIFARRRDPISVLELIESQKVEVLPTSPSFLRLLCTSKLARVHDTSSLKVITYGSEPMDPNTLARINDLFPNVQISQKYGATETGSPRSVSRGNDSLWLKFKNDGLDVKIVDGVLWIRSESVILGYLNAPSPVDQDGWYCTGDLVEVDGEWFRFRGRTADTINVGGEKVSPSEVEDTIMELDFVRDVAVTGKPHVLLGQVVTARVNLATKDLDAKEAITRIWQHCRRRLASYKAPVKIDVSSDALTNDRLKVQRSRAANEGASADHSPPQLDPGHIESDPHS